MEFIWYTKVSMQEKDLERFPQLASTPKIAQIPRLLFCHKSLFKSEHCSFSQWDFEGYHPKLSGIFKYLYH